jgi:hypothetical protein
MGINEQKNPQETLASYRKSKSIGSDKESVLSKLSDSELETLIRFGRSRARKVLIKYLELRQPDILLSMVNSPKPLKEIAESVVEMRGAFKVDSLLLLAHRAAEKEFKLRMKKSE